MRILIGIDVPKEVHWVTAVSDLGEVKRREGKRHHQAILAPARRRVNVPWSMLRDRRSFEVREPNNAVCA